MLQGFGKTERGFVSNTDDNEITAGRTLVWPLVIEKIGKSPLIGYGRNAMQRIGLRAWALDYLNDEFSHPHNAYLEYLLDNGILGFLCGMPIYGLQLRRSYQLFLDRSDVLFEVAGGISLALLMALLIAAVGAQTFYPREGVVPMWAALAVALRVWVQRENAMNGGPVFEEDAPLNFNSDSSWDSAAGNC